MLDWRAEWQVREESRLMKYLRFNVETQNGELAVRCPGGWISRDWIIRFVMESRRRRGVVWARLGLGLKHWLELSF